MIDRSIAPKYSVVIPVYQVEAFLPDCIDSVLSQHTQAPYELILVDDGSTDRSGGICDAYAAQDSRVRVTHIENQGVSHARNLGIQLARGRYILFLDSDDYWEPDFLQTMDAITETDPDMAAVGCARVYEDGRREILHLPVIPAGEPGADFLQSLFDRQKTPFYYSVCYAYRREFVLANGLYFPEELKVSEDFTQIMRAIPLASGITGCDRPVYNYRIRGGSVTASVTVKKLMDNLTSKASFFRQYPTASMANIYADNAALAAQLPREEWPQVAAFLKNNRDIWRHVSQTSLKLGGLLVACLGDCVGASVYQKLRKLARLIRS